MMSSLWQQVPLGSSVLKTSIAAGVAALAGSAHRLECSVEALSNVVPTDAYINFAYSLPENSTYDAGAGDARFPRSPTELPALCVVNVGQLDVATNTTWNFGLFLPNEWNGRFLASGNGGFGGGIDYLNMGTGAQYGFASMSSDLGHNSSALDGSWAYQNPEVLENWGWRALHESVVLAKHITKSYYAKAPAYNYYIGCSCGGKQGFKEAEEFPDDFDGIVAGAPAWYTTHLQLWNGWVGVVNQPAAQGHIPSSLFDIISSEVIKQCDPQDGLVDNIIMEPASCIFNPWTLLCSKTSNKLDACLTGDQVEMLIKLHSDWVIGNQTFVFPSFQWGSEPDWGLLVGSGQPATLGTDYVKYMLGLGPDWDWHTWNDSLVELSDRLNPGHANADNYDLTPFHKKGGKLLHYHGHADGSIPTGSSNYLYNQIYRTMTPQGVRLDDFYRFFLVPGMQHCARTPEKVNAPWYFAGAGQASALGTNVHSVPGYSDSRHDILLALMDWVEKDIAPDSIIATKYVDDHAHDDILRQRPICKYPLRAVFDQKGDPNSAESWSCRGLY